MASHALCFARGVQRAALADLSATLMLASATAASFAGVDRRAGALMVPLLAWEVVATALNVEIVRLNPEAGAAKPGAAAAKKRGEGGAKKKGQ